MAFTVAGTITGLQDVFARIDKLKRALRGKILRKAMDKATKPVFDAAKANTPKLTGLAVKSLGRKVKIYRESGTAVGIIGPRRGFKKSVVLAMKKGGVKGAIGGTKKAEKLAVGGGSVTRIFDPVRYFHFIELGRKAAAVKAKKILSSGLQVFGRNVAAATAHRPLQRAWSSQSGNAAAILRSEILGGIEAELPTTAT